MASEYDRTALIGLDWGTTSFRAYRLAADGRILDRIASDTGILSVDSGDFETTLTRQIAPWLTGRDTPPILASGMIGSRQGWREAPYVDAPAGIDALAAKLVHTGRDNDLEIHFVPGLSWHDTDGVPDVMRGEETQLIGALDPQSGPTLFVLPGTHSKWAIASEGRIVWFATFMTGEVFALLSRHSILGRLMSGGAHDADAFWRGLDRAATTQGSGPGLLHTLFGARSLPLFGELPETGVASYLSGLLIGTEIAEASRNPAFDGMLRSATIIGRSDLARHYETGLTAIGFTTHTADPDVCAIGLYRLASAAGLVGSDTQ